MNATLTRTLSPHGTTESTLGLMADWLSARPGFTVADCLIHVAKQSNTVHVENLSDEQIRKYLFV